MAQYILRGLVSYNNFRDHTAGLQLDLGDGKGRMEKMERTLGKEGYRTRGREGDKSMRGTGGQLALWWYEVR